MSRDNITNNEANNRFVSFMCLRKDLIAVNYSSVLEFTGKTGCYCYEDTPRWSLFAAVSFFFNDILSSRK